MKVTNNILTGHAYLITPISSLQFGELCRPNRLGLFRAEGLELLRQLQFLKLVFGPDFDPSQLRMLLFGTAMVLVMLWRPRGLEP